MIRVRVRILFALTMVAVFAMAIPLALRANAADDIAAMIANAKTAADHEAIATYYDHEATAAKEHVAMHRSMLAAIKKQGGPGIAKWHMDKHCEELIREHEAAAKLYTEMAQAEREIAKGVK